MSHLPANLAPGGLLTATLPKKLVQSVLVVVLYALAWQASALFEVQSNLSAAFLLTGLTVSLVMVGGPSLLPLCYLGFVLIPWYQWPMQAVQLSNVLDSLRHVSLYGGAGWYLHHLWSSGAFERIDSAKARRFLLVSLLATMVNTLAFFYLMPLTDWAHAPRPQLILSFWGGDLVGIVLLVPLAITLRHLYVNSHGQPAALYAQLGRLLKRAWPQPSILVGSLLSLMLFVVLDNLSLLPASEFSLLLLLPILVGALINGLLAGLVLAALVCGSLLVLIRLGLAPDMAIFNLQMLLLMSSITAMLAGAAHDDNLHEWHKANHDRLTELANQGRFLDRLDVEIKRSRRTAKPLALMYLDLDFFKQVNDQLGHLAGDEVLIEAARRMQACTRETDLVARIGGDEFAVLLIDLTDLSVVERIGQDLLAALKQPFRVEGQTAELGASIGLALYPDDALEGNALRHHADTALYQAKQGGRGHMVRYVPASAHTPEHGGRASPGHRVSGAQRRYPA